MAPDEIEVYRGAAVFGQRELIESILREERIPYVVRSEGGIAEHPVTVGPMGEFIVLVPPEHATQAEALLREVEEETPVDTDEEDDSGQPVGLFSRIRREPTPAERRRHLWVGVVSGSAGVILLFLEPPSLRLLGLLLLAIAWASLVVALKRPG